MSAHNAQTIDRRLSVAPMMDWTDRHCRYLHRLISARTLLYTEMITAAAIVHGDAPRLLSFAEAEQPVALQIGGFDPDLLARAVKTACDFGYPEINLNVGCPSDRVQNGAFGACLMHEPDLVADCVAAMIAAAGGRAAITVKCRLGVDDQDVDQTLPDFIAKVSAAGVSTFCIHARKAWLQGLSPKENRDIPPLDYDLVHAMKAAFPALHISVNGGITSLDQARRFLDAGLDGVMIGRAAYHTPADILLAADATIFGRGPVKPPLQIVDEMRPYIAAHLAAGGRLHQVTRHMLGLFAGRPGARHWRRALSQGATRPGAGLDVLDAAMAEMAGAAPGQLAS